MKKEKTKKSNRERKKEREMTKKNEERDAETVVRRIGAT